MENYFNMDIETLRLIYNAMLFRANSIKNIFNDKIKILKYDQMELFNLTLESAALFTTLEFFKIIIEEGENSE